MPYNLIDNSFPRDMWIIPRIFSSISYLPFLPDKEEQGSSFQREKQSSGLPEMLIPSRLFLEDGLIEALVTVQVMPKWEKHNEWNEVRIEMHSIVKCSS